MSMLAERKRKQKWCLNPRGTLWSEDSNKFGQKILERMGWSKGKGLGANENGIKEHVKVSFKNDSKGLGFQENSEQWTENEEKFAEILKSLANEDSNPAEAEVKIVSLEKLSKKSKARVHYKKFTRGKDLSRASEKDLACIFGKRSSVSEKKEDCQDDEKSSKEDSDTTFVNSGSSREYFKRRLESKGFQNGFFKEKAENENEELTDYSFKGFSCGSDLDANSKPNKYEVTNEGKGFGFAFKVGSSTFSDSVHSGDISKKRKCEDGDDLNEKKKKKKKDLEFKDSDLTKKKSKKSKQKNVESMDVDSLPYDETSEKCLQNEGIVNPALELSIDGTDSVVNEIKKKKKKNKQVLNSEISVDADATELGVSLGKNKTKKQNGEIEVLDNYIEDDSLKPKKKKKNAVLNGDDLPTKVKKENRNPALELSLEDEVPLEIEDKQLKKKKKNKNKMEEGLTNPALELSLDDEASFEAEDKAKKSKKKKHKNIEDGLINPALELSLDDDATENSIQIDRKNNERIIDVIEKRIVEIPSSLKKRKYNENGELIISPKKCKKSVKFNDTLNEEIFITGNSFEIIGEETKDEKCMDNETVKKQKKKRRKDSVEGGIDNGGFSEKIHEVNIDIAVTKKEKKKRKNGPSENGIDNIGFSEKINDSVNENSVDVIVDNAVAKKEKKKKKKNEPSEIGIDNIGFSEKINDSVNENSVDVIVDNAVAKKEKKKKKKKNEPEEIGIDNIGFSEKINDSIIVDSPVAKKEKKKRKIELSENGIDNIGFSEENNETAETFLNVLEINDTNSNKSKKKKDKKKENGIDNPSFGININSFKESESPVNVNNESLEVVKEKKKKQQNEVVENDVKNIEFSEIKCEDTSTDGNSNKKKKSKDKKRKKSESGPDNHSFETNESEKNDENDNDENLTLNMLNILSSNIKVNKKKKLKTENAELKNGINNLAFDDKMSNNANSSVASDVSELNLSEAIEVFQAELENNINEAKVKRKTKKDKQSPDSSLNNVDTSQNVTGNEKDNTIVEQDSLGIDHSELQMNITKGKGRGGADKIDKKYLLQTLVSGQIEVAFPGANLHVIPGYGPK